VIYWVEVIHI